MAVSVTIRIDNLVPEDIPVLTTVLQAEADKDDECRSCRFRSTGDALIAQQVWMTHAGFAAYREGAVAEALRQLAAPAQCLAAAFAVPDRLLGCQQVTDPAAQPVPGQLAPRRVAVVWSAGPTPAG